VLKFELVGAIVLQ